MESLPEQYIRQAHEPETKKQECYVHAKKIVIKPYNRIQEKLATY